MKYGEFKEFIHVRLSARPSGMTWKQLKDELDLPYDRPCPEWTQCLEREIGLVRRKGTGSAFVWSVEAKKKTNFKAK